MDALWLIIISNSIVACAIALVAAIAARLRASPGIVHILLLLAILKLFTPPILPVGIPGSILPEPVRGLAAHVGSSAPQVGILIENAAGGSALAAGAEARGTGPFRSAGRWSTFASAQSIFVALWIAGALVMAAWHSACIITMCRLIRLASAAPSSLIELAESHAARLGIARVPGIIALPVRITPAVWFIGGRPRIIFPAELIDEMSSEHLETLLIHELAHVKRRDHLVRLLEVVAMTVFWWHPLVWWAKAQLREMEERACDAYVLGAVPGGQRSYATALIETLDFLSVNPRPLPVIVTAASPTVSLQRRIAMMKDGSHRTATRCAALIAAAFGLPAMTIALAAQPPAPAQPTASHGQRLVVRQDGDQLIVARVRTHEQRVAAAFGLDLSVPLERTMVETLVQNGVDFPDIAEEQPLVLHRIENEEGRKRMVIKMEGAEGDPRVMLFGGDNAERRQLMLSDIEGAEGKPRIMFRGKGDNAEGDLRVLFGNADLAEALPRLLFRGEGIESQVRVLRLNNGQLTDLLRGEAIDGEALIRLDNGQNADGQQRLIIRGDGAEVTTRVFRFENGENASGKQPMIFRFEGAPGESPMLRLQNGVNLDGKRLFVHEPGTEGKRILMFRGEAGEGAAPQVILRREEPKQ